MFSPWKNVPLNPTPSPSTVESPSSISSYDSGTEDFAPDMASDRSASVSLTSRCIRPHERYYFHEPNVQLVVEDAVYNLPRTLLSRLSARFRECFNRGADVLPPGWLVHKTDLGEHIYINCTAGLAQKTRPSVVGSFADAYPIFGVTAQEFDAFLSVIIREQEEDDRYNNKGKWLSVLKVATLFDILFIRTIALRHLDSPAVALTPLERLQIGRTHDVSDWADNALRALIQRAESLREDEVTSMRAKDVVFVTSSREQAARKAQCDESNPYLQRATTPTNPMTHVHSPIPRLANSSNASPLTPPLGSPAPIFMASAAADALPATSRGSLWGSKVPSPMPAEKQALESIKGAPPAPPEAKRVDEVPAVEVPIGHGGIPGGFGDEDDDPPPPLPPPALEPSPDVAVEPEVQQQPPAPPAAAWDSVASRAPASKRGSAAPSVRAASPISPPSEKSSSPQLNSDAEIGLPSSMNASPGDESGGGGGDLEEEKGDDGWGFGSGNKRKGKGSAWGAMTNNNNYGWNDGTSFFDTLGSDPTPVADGLLHDTAAGSVIDKKASTTAIPSYPLTENSSGLTTPPSERVDIGEKAPTVEFKAEDEDDWWNEDSKKKKKKKGSKGPAGTSALSGAPAGAATRGGKGKATQEDCYDVMHTSQDMHCTRLITNWSGAYSYLHSLPGHLNLEPTEPNACLILKRKE
ncbi:unnamed protein product [Peniophora sp. CBMAI 1063]|nr:unnamed protein product [Peniophora sp. CBMAI 1063]